jgi:hypothetical protein
MFQKIADRSSKTFSNFIADSLNHLTTVQTEPVTEYMAQLTEAHRAKTRLDPAKIAQAGMSGSSICSRKAMRSFRLSLRFFNRWSSS